MTLNVEPCTVMGTAVIPRTYSGNSAVLQVKLAVIPRVWSGLLQYN